MLLCEGFPVHHHAQFAHSHSELPTVPSAPLSLCLCLLPTLGAHPRNHSLLQVLRRSSLLQAHLKFELSSPFLREIQFSYVSYIFSKVSITQVAALYALGPRPCAVHCSLLLHHQPLRKSHCQSFRLEHNLVTACSGDVVLELDKYRSRFSVSLLSIFRMCAPHCSSAHYHADRQHWAGGWDLRES